MSSVEKNISVVRTEGKRNPYCKISYALVLHSIGIRGNESKKVYEENVVAAQI